jgi:hypothetical protein
MLVAALLVSVLPVVGCSSAPTPEPTATAPPAAPTPAAPTPTEAPPAPSPTTRPTPTGTAISSPTARPAVFGDGTFLVPDEVLPGTYRTTSYTSDCYWTRLRGFESGLADLIASRIGDGYHVATILETDAGFDSVSCGGWTTDLSPATQSRGEFEDGIFIVGVDIEPGMYAPSVVATCHWARLSGFSAAAEETLEEVYHSAADASPVVMLDPADVGFLSDGCGTWRAVGAR